MNDCKIMIVDDEEIILESINDYLREYDIRTYSDPRDAIKELEKNTYDIIVSDYKMPKMNGLEFFTLAKKRGAYLYGILLTAYADKDLLETFIDRDIVKKVIEKPLKLEPLKEAIDNGIEECDRMKEELAMISNMKLICHDAFKGIDFLNDRIIGIDSGLRDVFKKAEYIACTNENVLITGETGTGKEVVARAIHLSSARKDGPFIKINCGAIPESLIESELFGYERGAFSGAQRDKPGKIELSRGGTLFLDEIGELTPDMQTRFLHVVQEKSIERLGSNKTIKVDFRLVAATNRNLEKSIKERSFRDDLYYRISAFPIHIPPLRERTGDIGPMVQYLAGKYARELGYMQVSIHDSAVESLKLYEWPGNVRELENVVKRAILLMDKDKGVIEDDDFAYLFHAPGAAGIPYDRAINIINENIINNKTNLKTVEKDIIAGILAFFNGNITEAVKRSGIPKDRFYRNR